MSIAFLFPGQGAQKSGMGRSFFESDPDARAVYEKASELLDMDMASLCFEEDEKLHVTEYTQAAMVTTGIAMLKSIEKTSLHASVCAGLSLGEYEALYYTGALGMEDAIRGVRRRGVLMQEAVPRGVGGMAAVLQLSAEKIEECIENVPDIWIANYNCPGQIVLSGRLSSLKTVEDKLKAAGAKRVLMLNVSGPFHSGLLSGAADGLAEVLKDVEINDPRIPYVANYTAEYVHSSENIKELLRKQVYGSVRFEQSIHRMLADGVDCFVEIGPGKTLGSFVNKIDKTAKVYNIETFDDMERVAKELESR